MEFAADVIFLVLSSVNNDLHIYVLSAGVDCEVTYVGTTELKYVPCVSAMVTCAISFSNKETQIKDLDPQIPGTSKYLT